jgi:hypothetical protein
MSSFNPYSTSDIKRKNKSRRMDWSGQMTFITDRKHVKGMDERLILKQIT